MTIPPLHSSCVCFLYHIWMTTNRMRTQQRRRSPVRVTQARGKKACMGRPQRCFTRTESLPRVRQAVLQEDVVKGFNACGFWKCYYHHMEDFRHTICIKCLLKKSSHLLIKQKHDHESKVTLCFRPQRAWISTRKDLLMQKEDTWPAPAGQLHQRTACFDLSLSQLTGRNKGFPSETFEYIKTMHHLKNNTINAGWTQVTG